MLHFVRKTLVCSSKCCCLLFIVFLLFTYSLTKFVQDNETDDPLLNPTEVNPFKEKAKCIIL